MPMHTIEHTPVHAYTPDTHGIVASAARNMTGLHPCIHIYRSGQSTNLMPVACQSTQVEEVHTTM